MTKAFESFLRRLGFKSGYGELALVQLVKDYGGYDGYSSNIQPTGAYIIVDGDGYIRVNYPMHNCDFVGAGFDDNILNVNNNAAENLNTFNAVKIIIDLMNTDIDKILKYISKHPQDEEVL